MLNQNEIDDIIITALEGGSNYWYLLHEEGSVDEVLRKIKAGEGVKVYDIEGDEDDEPLGILTKKSIRKGIKQCIEDGQNEVWDVKKDEWDSDTADVLFQYFVMNEIVYG